MSRNAKYTLNELKEIVKTSISMADVCRKLDLKLAGGTISHLKFKCAREKIDTSHFLGKSSNRGKKSSNKKLSLHILVEGNEGDYRTKTYQLKRALIENGVEYACNKCKLTCWHGEEIILEIDHVNGKYWDNRKENLQFMCPNCHSIKTKNR